jgi:hypothetical protein
MLPLKHFRTEMVQKPSVEGLAGRRSVIRIRTSESKLTHTGQSRYSDDVQHYFTTEI